MDKAQIHLTVDPSVKRRWQENAASRGITLTAFLIVAAERELAATSADSGRRRVPKGPASGALTVAPVNPPIHVPACGTFARFSDGERIVCVAAYGADGKLIEGRALSGETPDQSTGGAPATSENTTTDAMAAHRPG